MIVFDEKEIEADIPRYLLSIVRSLVSEFISYIKDENRKDLQVPHILYDLIIPDKMEAFITLEWLENAFRILNDNKDFLPVI